MSSISEVSKTDKKYAGWLFALKLFGRKWFGWTEETNPSPKSWKPLYDEGYTPLGALQLDLKEQPN